MKSLLTVLSLLAIGSIANADLTLTVNGEVHPDLYALYQPLSTIAVIGIHNDDPGQIGLAVFLHVTYNGELFFEPQTVINVVNGPDGVIDMGTLDPAWAGIIQVNLAKPDPPFNIPMGIVADNIIFHLGDIEPGMIAMTDSQIPGLGTILDSVPFQEVPEPVTLALLVLGSISMRRRKRLVENN